VYYFNLTPNPLYTPLPHHNSCSDFDVFEGRQDVGGGGPLLEYTLPTVLWYSRYSISVAVANIDFIRTEDC